MKKIVKEDKMDIPARLVDFGLQLDNKSNKPIELSLFDSKFEIPKEMDIQLLGYNYQSECEEMTQGLHFLRAITLQAGYRDYELQFANDIQIDGKIFHPPDYIDPLAVNKSIIEIPFISKITLCPFKYIVNPGLIVMCLYTLVIPRPKLKKV